MYNNIGKKIKNLAKWTAIVEAITAVIVGIVLMATGYSQEITYGLILAALGPIVAWVSSFLVYGFGELIDKTCDIEYRLRASGSKENPYFEEKKRAKQDNNSHIFYEETNQRNDELERLRTKGLITEEEYRRIIAKRYKNE